MKYALGFATSLALAWTAVAAQETIPTFRIGAEMVVVDMIATDREGNFPGELRPADIRLLEDGRPQEVRFVRAVRRGPAAPGADESGGQPTRTVPAVGDADMADTVGPVVVIAVDLGSMPRDAWLRVRESISRLVRDELPPGTPMMVVTLENGVTVRQALTVDRAAIARAVDGLPIALSGALTIAEIVEGTDQACDSTGDPKMLQMTAVSLGRELLAETRRRIAAASEGVATLARILASRPGRKHVVLYSAGYLVNGAGDVIDAVAASMESCSPPSDRDAIRRRLAESLSSSQGTDFAASIQAAVDRANRAQVSIYTIDPRGLVTGSATAQQRVSARAARGGAVQAFIAIDQLRSQQYLRTMAGETGGRSFLNSNDLSAGLRRAWLDASEYYLVGYAPADGRARGRFRKIEMQLTRPGLTLVSHRRGYYDATDQEIAQADVAAALANPDAFTRDGFDVEATTEGGMLRVVAFIPPAALRREPTGEAQRVQFSLHAALRDQKGALVGGKALFGRDVTLRLDAARLAAFLGSEHVEIPTDARAPGAGTYRLAVAIRDSSGWIAARSIELTVAR